MRGLQRSGVIANFTNTIIATVINKTANYAMPAPHFANTEWCVHRFGRGRRSCARRGVGIVGALAEWYSGYQAHARLVKALGTPDFVIGLLEDLVTIGGSLSVISRF